MIQASLLPVYVFVTYIYANNSCDVIAHASCSHADDHFLAAVRHYVSSQRESNQPARCTQRILADSFAWLRTCNPRPVRQRLAESLWVASFAPVRVFRCVRSYMTYHFRRRVIPQSVPSPRVPNQSFISRVLGSAHLPTAAQGKRGIPRQQHRCQPVQLK